jgi:hypothetical protein
LFVLQSVKGGYATSTCKLRLSQVAANGGTSGYGHDASWRSLLLLHFGDHTIKCTYQLKPLVILIYFISNE